MTTYGYIKIADTEHGELGHNGWTYVLNNPYSTDDKGHPAYYEETGGLTVALGRTLADDDCDPIINFREIYMTSRGGVAPRAEINIPITVELARAATANRAAYDDVHRPAGGYKIITD